MHYIAHKPFSVTPQGSEHVHLYTVGDTVEGFDAWPERAKRVHLDGGFIRCHGTPLDHEALVLDKNRDLLREVEQLRAVVAAANLIAKPENVAKADDAAEPPYAEFDDASVVGDELQDVPETAALAHGCDLCERAFATKKGLAKHRTQAHGGL